MSAHPRQPLERDARGVVRFRRNALVCHLVDWCARRNGVAGYAPLQPDEQRAPDLNELARLRFPVEDRRQLAQLLGYSVSGYGELPYADDDEELVDLDRGVLHLLGRGEAVATTRESDGADLCPTCGRTCGEKDYWLDASGPDDVSSCDDDFHLAADRAPELVRVLRELLVACLVAREVEDDDDGPVRTGLLGRVQHLLGELPGGLP